VAPSKRAPQTAKNSRLPSMQLWDIIPSLLGHGRELQALEAKSGRAQDRVLGPLDANRQDADGDASSSLPVQSVRISRGVGKDD
jgi:hypothetical protein